jgi:FtsP/CotA-like multicopper oxidase with cupredoxin domain
MAMVGGVTLALPFDAAKAFAGAQVSPFRVPLSIPPVLKPIGRSAGRDLYVTRMRQSYAEILPGRRTKVWAFDGHFPGPTIKVKRGKEVVVRRINQLEVPTTIHLHGGKVRPASDGQPLDLIHPGERKDYIYPNDQAGATLWYHDHTHHHTSRNNYMGLSGVYIIEDEDERDLNLPRGKFDIPLVLQDRAFKSDGSFRFNDHHDAVTGDTLLVNGRPTPYLKVTNRKFRFRILNGSHSRGYELALDSGLPLVQIGSDGGLLAAPNPARTIPLWPAERADVVIDFSVYPVGTKVVLQDRQDPTGLLESNPIMRFDVVAEADDPSSLPATLASIERLAAGSVERQFNLSFDFDIQQWQINGKPFDPKRIDARPRLGDVETWVFHNQSSVTHPMHIHLAQFQVLSRSNMAVSAGELGWKDTVRVDPSATVKVAVKFDGYVGRYMFHCHNLAHEDHSMMGQMRVRRA